MTFEDMGKSMKELRDNQVVQGQILHRIDSRLDRMELIVEQNSLAIARNTEAISRNTEAIGKLADGFVQLQSAMKGMVQTVEGLSATVERFIRGMEGDGHIIPPAPREVNLPQFGEQRCSYS
jgi:hypothetical protein